MEGLLTPSFFSLKKKKLLLTQVYPFKSVYISLRQASVTQTHMLSGTIPRRCIVINVVSMSHNWRVSTTILQPLMYTETEGPV